jgi:sulfate/thiosulfate transport system permease protein
MEQSSTRFINLKPSVSGAKMSTATAVQLWWRRRILPGFGLTVGITLLYLSVIVLIPLSATFVKAAGMGWDLFFRTVTAPRVLASYQVTFGTSLVAAALNGLFGSTVAWILVRYKFPGRNLLDAMVDLPFALPTSVAGISLAAIYAPNGWLGHPILAWTGIKVAYTQLGILVALIFVGLPFVVRTVQPVLEDLDLEFEEAAASLGASRLQTIFRVVGPEIYPALLTGFTLSFARAVGEYGSVVFIAGNMPMKTEIIPLLIITKLEQYDYRGATAIAVVMLLISFLLLLLINGLQRWSREGKSR